MVANPKYSIIVPVYNRPEELAELLQSITLQTYDKVEVIVVEDGSQRTSQSVCEQYAKQLALNYILKTNSGPGPSRNAGIQQARGEYVVFFDSDCILPPDYFASVERHMVSASVDAWGGPDRGHENFTLLQRAMAYTMSSVLTTGGIRGANADNFQPRSFNMGIRRSVAKSMGGFAFDRLAEDIELSVRMKKAGLMVVLIREAFVYHKRRTNLMQFYRQVNGFGRGRVRVGKIHPDQIKLTHWFPFLYTLGLLSIPLISWLSLPLGILVILTYKLYAIAIFVDGWRVTHSAWVGLLSVPAAVVQLVGYGVGFLREKVG